MSALIGRYEYALDPKHRVFVPPRYREELAREKGNHFILSVGLDRCLYLFLPSQWDKLLNDSREIFQHKDRAKQRALKRYIFSNAQEVQLDDQGRILIPTHLVEHARLKRDVVVLGSGTKAEIWDKAAHDAQSKSAKKIFDQLSGALDL